MAATGAGKDHRGEIVRVATSTIARAGLPGLRVRAVARDVGITHATLHYYFPTKADLINAVLRELIYEGIAVPLVERSEAATPTEELAGVLHGVAAGYGDDERGAAMMEFLRHGRTEDVAEPFGRYLTTWRRFLVDLLDRGIEAGEFRADLDRDATAGLLMELSLGLQTRAPLPAGVATSAVDQLLRLVAP